jgi:hypothetical protein
MAGEPGSTGRRVPALRVRRGWGTGVRRALSAGSVPATISKVVKSQRGTAQHLRRRRKAGRSRKRAGPSGGGPAVTAVDQAHRMRRQERRPSEAYAAHTGPPQSAAAQRQRQPAGSLRPGQQRSGRGMSGAGSQRAATAPAPLQHPELAPGDEPHRRRRRRPGWARWIERPIITPGRLSDHHNNDLHKI